MPVGINRSQLHPRNRGGRRRPGASAPMPFERKKEDKAVVTPAPTVHPVSHQQTRRSVPLGATPLEGLSALQASKQERKKKKVVCWGFGPQAPKPQERKEEQKKSRERERERETKQGSPESSILHQGGGWGGFRDTVRRSGTARSRGCRGEDCNRA